VQVIKKHEDLKNKFSKLSPKMYTEEFKHYRNNIITPKKGLFTSGNFLKRRNQRYKE